MRTTTTASSARRHTIHRIVAAFSLALAVTSCAAGSHRSGATTDRNLITSEMIQERHFSTAYEVVESLRANWLSSRGLDSFGAPTTVQVYLDITRMGGLDQLRSISTQNIVYIRYYDGIAATARWGLDHGGGAILVSTHP
jgi:hypothetical protein